MLQMDFERKYGYEVELNADGLQNESSRQMLEETWKT